MKARGDEISTMLLRVWGPRFKCQGLNEEIIKVKTNENSIFSIFRIRVYDKTTQQIVSFNLSLSLSILNSTSVIHYLTVGSLKTDPSSKKKLQYFLFPRTLRRLPFVRERAIVLVGGRAEVESRKGVDMRVAREPMQASYPELPLVLWIDPTPVIHSQKTQAMTVAMKAI